MLFGAGRRKDPATIAETVEANGVTAIHFVPSMLGAFLEYIEHGGTAGKMRSVRRVFASGEALMTEHVRRFNRLLGAGGATLHNLYGPTEATVEVAYYDCPVEQEPESIPIGKPIDNVKLYILDSKDRLQPIGVPGELHIGGLRSPGICESKRTDGGEVRRRPICGGWTDVPDRRLGKMAAGWKH